MALSSSLCVFYSFVVVALAVDSATEGTCVATREQIVRSVNGSSGGAFQEVIINCLAYADAQRTIEYAVVSGFPDGMEGTRYTVECQSGLLLVERSDRNATNQTVSGCHQCTDSSELCSGSEQVICTNFRHTPCTSDMHSCTCESVCLKCGPLK